MLLSLPDAPAMFAGLSSRGDGRGARTGRHQARRPVGAMRVAADDAGAGVPSCRAVGDGGASGARSAPMSGAERVIEEPDGAPPELGDDAAGGRAVLGRPYGPGSRAAA